MKDKLTLFNHFHNGDLFYSRVILLPLIKNYDITYYHKLSTPLFSDLPEVTEINGIPKEFNQNETYLEKNIINTWMGQNNMKFVNTSNPGCSFDNYFKIAEQIFNFYKIDIRSDIDHLPIINFDKLKDFDYIKKILENYKNNYKKLILIANGNVMSYQSLNFDMTNIIITIARQNPDCLFFVTQNLNFEEKNIINTSTITNKIPDLLEIGLISYFCDIIIGRASGPHCFTHTKENIMNPNKTYISFTNLECEGKWFKNSKAKQIWTNVYNSDNIFNIINNEIKT